MTPQEQGDAGRDRDAISISLRGGLAAVLVVVAATAGLIVVASLVAALASFQ